MMRELSAAWARLGEEELLRIASLLGWSGWRVAEGRIEGSCPFCEVDRDSGYVYVRRDGSTPWLNCHRAKRCGRSASLYRLIANRLGEAAAIRYVLELAGLDPRPHRRRPGDSAGAPAKARPPRDEGTERRPSGGAGPRPQPTSTTYRTSRTNTGLRGPVPYQGTQSPPTCDPGFDPSERPYG